MERDTSIFHHTSVSFEYHYISHLGRLPAVEEENVYFKTISRDKWHQINLFPVCEFQFVTAFLFLFSASLSFRSNGIRLHIKFWWCLEKKSLVPYFRCRCRHSIFYVKYSSHCFTFSVLPHITLFFCCCFVFFPVGCTWGVLDCWHSEVGQTGWSELSLFETHFILVLYV